MPFPFHLGRGVPRGIAPAISYRNGIASRAAGKKNGHGEEEEDEDGEGKQEGRREKNEAEISRGLAMLRNIAPSIL